MHLLMIYLYEYGNSVHKKLRLSNDYFLKRINRSN